jgi:carbon-monoxide dehydrogenase large subunit
VSLPVGQAAGLEHTAYYTPTQAAYCSGTHVVEVEVDIMTGGVKILRYTVAHDSGRVINPLIVDGQVQGGVAHGIGNALLEWMQYDENAQPLTTSFADYMLPMATDVPTCAIAHVETINPLNPLGVKGAGEGGTIPGGGGDHRGDRRRAVFVWRALCRNAADAGAHCRGAARGRRL